VPERKQLTRVSSILLVHIDSIRLTTRNTLAGGTTSSKEVKTLVIREVVKKAPSFVIITLSRILTSGVYHGKLVFPKEYPHKPPSIYMITPR